MTDRYLIQRGDGTPWVVVDKATWVAAEREAGFRNTMGQPDEPGTAGFGTTANGGLYGRIEWAAT